MVPDRLVLDITEMKKKNAASFRNMGVLPVGMGFLIRWRYNWINLRRGRVRWLCWGIADSRLQFTKNFPYHAGTQHYIPANVEAVIIDDRWRRFPRLQKPDFVKNIQI